MPPRASIMVVKLFEEMLDEFVDLLVRFSPLLRRPTSGTQAMFDNCSLGTRS